MNLTGLIESAERKYKQVLEEFFITVYNEKILSSHGIDHHRRVWNYSKKLLPLLYEQKPFTISRFPSKLIIACYLHDTGMQVETGISHGKHGQDFCIRFLEKHHLPQNEYQEVLEAIGNHDLKDYKGSNIVNNLLTILSVADDLDAFGFTGIFRYSEINLIRGISPKEIGHLIIKNASHRFEYFVKTFGFSNEMVQEHRKRYEILDDFFNEYNKQAGLYQFGGKHITGYCGVMDLFTIMIKNNIQLKDFLMKPDKYSFDPIIRWFFEDLKSELS
jgi:HD superfamily phosphodiesterase